MIFIKIVTKIRKNTCSASCQREWQMNGHVATLIDQKEQ